MALVCAGLAVCNVLVAAAAQAQDVSFEEAQNFAVGQPPWSGAVGDFNGDGVQDLAVANSNSNNVSVLLGNGDGSFQGRRTSGPGTVPHPSRWATSIAMGCRTWPWPTSVPTTSRCSSTTRRSSSAGLTLKSSCEDWLGACA